MYESYSIYPSNSDIKYHEDSFKTEEEMWMQKYNQNNNNA